MSAKPAATLDELHARILATRAATPAGTGRQFRHAVRGEEARTGRRGNGGPDLDAPEPRMLRHGAAEVMRVASAMFGRRWKAELAEALGEHSRQLRRWASGESAPDTRARTWLLAEARRHRAELDAAIASLELLEPMPPAPAAPEPEPEPTPAASTPTPAPILHPGVDPAAGAWVLDAVMGMIAECALPEGTPTFVREVLAVRMPTASRFVHADIVMFDGQTHTLEIDRGNERDRCNVTFKAGEGEHPHVNILFDEAAWAWERGANWAWRRPPYQRVYQPRPPKPDPAPAAPARPGADPRQVDIEDLLSDAGLLGD
ncbi:hypothetical protein E8E01_19385 [Methylorubrum populi]|uniref:hypothetical protein n=1 Tax=Methylorubrum populi TaxID=223967 RepID=UPI00114DCC3C|nr:hypothetical protein [Methylorubrum populi]QDI82425.1 hypothetical protein E8E01_19385 [Methylorubrum populi]